MFHALGSNGHLAAVITAAAVGGLLLVVVSLMSFRQLSLATNAACLAIAVAISSALEVGSETTSHSPSGTHIKAVYCSALYLALAGLVGVTAVALSPRRRALDQLFEALERGAGLGRVLPYDCVKQCIYLDYNGTSPIFPEVSREMLPYVTSCFGNPSSSHAHGVASKAAVDLARKRVAALVGCDEDEIVFTCSGTESDNWALLGALRQHASTAAAGDRGSAPHIVSSAIEHPAVLEQLRDLQRRGAAEFTLVGVGAEGAVSAREVAEALTERTVLVTLMHSNNEVGSLQPVAEVAKLCREKGILCHTDAAQSLGKVKIDVRELGVDMLTIVGHKFGAPKGIAALYIRREVLADFPPFLLGGGQEGGKRAGTESTAMIVGLGKACQIALEEADATTAHMRKLRDLLLASLERRLPPGTLSQVHGPSDVARRLPNTLSIAVDGIRAAPLLKRIGDRFAASAGAARHSVVAGDVDASAAAAHDPATPRANAGAACHSKPADGSAAADCPKISAVLRAMGVPPSLAVGTIRLSVGRHTTAEEVERGADILAAAIRQELSAAA